MKLNNKRQLLLGIKWNMFWGNYDKAVLQTDAALKNWPAEVDVLELALEVYDGSRRWNQFFGVYDLLEPLYTNEIPFNLSYGNALLASFEYERAVLRFRYVIDHWNMDASYFRNLANVYARLAICYGYLGQWDLLDSALQEAKNIAGWDPDMTYGQLLYYCGTGDIDKLLTYLNEMLERYPRLHSLYYWRGLYAEHYLHDDHEAVIWYEAALRKVSWIETRRSSWREFFSFWHYASPSDVLKHCIDAYLRLGESRKALSFIYTQKVRILDSDINVRALRIYFDVRSQNYSIAEQKCKELLSTKSLVDKKGEYYYLLALTLFAQGNLEQGLVNVKLAIDSDSDMIAAWELLALIYLTKEDWSSAIQTYQKLTSICHFNYASWRRLGYCYYKMDNLILARSSYEQALSLNPFDADSWVELADIYVGSGKRELALDAYKKSLAFTWLDPNKRQHAIQAQHNLQ